MSKRTFRGYSLRTITRSLPRHSGTSLPLNMRSSALGDGHSLVRVAAELSYDLIIINAALPILNGLDPGQQIKELL
jgi:DNA-binding response OmpR family regulator